MYSEKRTCLASLRSIPNAVHGTFQPMFLYIKYPNDIGKAVGNARRHALRRRLV